MSAVFQFVIPFIVTAGVILPAARLAIRRGFVDTPDLRKVHKAPVPPIGGLIIFPVYIAWMVLSKQDPGVYWSLWAGIGLLLITGALDDARGLNPWVKFWMQVLVALIVVVGGEARLYQLGNLLSMGDVGLDILSVPFSVVAVVLLINGMNLIDGLDGLAGGIGFLTICWLLAACIIAGQPDKALQILPLLGVITGFLIYNIRSPFRERAAVFLGDSGSMALGLILGWFCIDYAQEPAPVIEPISVAWLLALPIIDMCAQFLRRVRSGQHPFHADRGHFHHHVVDSGLPVRSSTFLLLGLVFVLGAVGYLGVYLDVPRIILTVLWVGLLYTHMRLSLYPEKYKTVIERMKNALS